MVKTIQAGMNTDVEREFLPNGDYTYAMSMLPEQDSGDTGSKRSEQGNKFILDAPYTIIGHTSIGLDEEVIFSTDNENSEIGIFNTRTDGYTTILNSDCLNFNINNPVFALHRLRKGCENTVYFTDRRNKYRVINLNSEDFGENFDCNTLLISPDFTIPSINPRYISDSGGTLKVGTYKFSIRYLDEDYNSTNWIYLTSPIVIYDEAQTQDYYLIDGAINEEDEPSVGSVPATSKSIILDIEDLDTRFEYYQLAVVEHTSGSGEISSVWVLDQRQITGATTSFKYGGASTSDGHYQGDIADIIVGNEIIEIVNHHEQIDNTLILGGFTNKEYDFAAFQQAANNITVTPAIKTYNTGDTSSLGDSKNALTSFNGKSLMGNEVYALAIQYSIDGKWTEAFHIPGRAKDVFDSQLIPLGPNTDFYGEAVETWLMDSTGTETKMGYYEGEEDYPDSLDCEGNRIFPRGRVRHHKLPSRRVIPVHDGTQANALGLNFSNVVYPDSNITNHRFLISKRDESSSTVLDGGVNLNLKCESSPETSTIEMNGLGVYPGRSCSARTESTCFLSPKTLLREDNLNVSYAKFNYAYRREIISEISKVFPTEGVSNLNNWVNIRLTYTNLSSNNPISSTLINRTIDGNLYVGPNSVQTVIQGFNDGITDYLGNDSYTNRFNFIHVKDGYQDSNTYNYVTLHSNNRPYNNLSSIYYRVYGPSSLIEASTEDIFDGDVWITKLTVADIPFYRSSDRSYHADVLEGAYVESELNYELKYGGTLTCDTVLKHEPVDYGEALDYFITKVATLNDDGSWTERDTICQEFYGYNPDFDKITDEVAFAGVLNNFDYCDSCVNAYPYRLRYSEQSYQDDLSDNYRVFKSNNWIELNGDTGRIEALVTDKGQLYCLTEGAPFFVSVNAQRLNTDESTVYIGTGDRFSLPPKKMVTSSNQYGGTKDPLSVLKTEYGVFYADRLNGKIFHISDALDEISNKGMYHEFKNSFTISTDNGNSVINEDGTGIIAGYDKNSRCVFFTKRDFNPLYSLNGNNNGLFFNGGLYNFIRWDGVPMQVNTTNFKYFERKDRTISYYLPGQRWNSYHWYHPSNYITSNKGLYHINNNLIYKALDGEELTFFEEPAIAEIDLSFNDNPHITKMFDSIDVSTSTYDGKNNWIPNTFNSGIFYTEDQTTGIIELEMDNDNPFNFYTPQLGVEPITRVDENIRINCLYNNMIERGDVFTQRWDMVIDDFPIFETANEDIIDQNKNLFNREPLKGKWLGARLSFNKDENKYIKVKLAHTNSKISIR